MRPSLVFRAETLITGFVDGSEAQSRRYACTIERGDQFHEVVAKLSSISVSCMLIVGKEEKGFGLIASPGHFGFGLVFLPRTHPEV